MFIYQFRFEMVEKSWIFLLVSLLVKGKTGFRGPGNPGKSVKQGIQ